MTRRTTRTWLLGLLVPVALAACAPAVGDGAARLRAFQADLDAAWKEWQARAAQRAYPSSLAATADLMSRYQAVYARWGLQVDVLTRTLLNYSLALAARVDRGQMSPERANILLLWMKHDMDAAKPTLDGASRDPERREAAMVRWWAEYWQANRERYEASAEDPVTCATEPAPYGGLRVRCS
jgi:hypothetical protein